MTPNPIVGAAGQAISFKITNPATNAYALTGFDLVAPSGWTVTVCTFGALLNGEAITTGACQFSIGTGGAAINPGSKDTLGVTVTPASSSTYPISGTFTSTVQDASSTAFYAGPTFSVQVIATGTTVGITVTPGGSNTVTSYTAGTAVYTVTAALSSAQAGVTIVWSDTGTGASSATYPSSFAAASSTTASDGTASTTYQPSETAGLTGILHATIGTSSITHAAASTITTYAGAPTGQSIAFASTDTKSGNHYVTTSGTTVNQHTTAFSGATIASTSFFIISLTDAFSNPVALNAAGLTAWTVRIVVASGGKFDASSTAFNLATTLSCGSAVVDWQDGSGNNLAPVTACPTGAISSFTIPFAYFQTTTYGFSSVINLAFSGTFKGNVFTPAGTTSAQIITSTLGTVGSVNVYDPVAAVYNPATVVAGGSVIVSANLTYAQVGVPVNFTLSASTVGYAGTFSNGLQTIIAYSAKHGGYYSAQATFTIDTNAQTPASTGFAASINKPIDNTVPNWLTPVPTAAVTTTTVAAASALNVAAFFSDTGVVPDVFVGAATSYAIAGLTLKVNVQMQDAYGNPVPYVGTYQLQVTLSPATDILSATTVYIKPGGTSTGYSFGGISWTMPSSGSSVSLSASAVYGGHTLIGSKTITIVSKTPTILVTAPASTSGVAYSKGTFTQFAGGANASFGYPTSDLIASVGYHITGGINGFIAGFTPANKATWNLPLTLAAGLTTITFNATDSHSNTVTSAPLQVLVDPTGPTITFPTTLTLTGGHALAVTIVSAYGDLNTTSVTATYGANAATVTLISGSNTLGSSSSFVFAITGITAGTWTVTVHASSLSGVSVSKSASVTMTILSNQTFTSPGASQTTSNGFTVVSATFTNNAATSMSVTIYSVWYVGTSTGPIAFIAPAPVTIAAGASYTYEFGVTTPGTYVVQVFVSGGLSISYSATVTVT